MPLRPFDEIDLLIVDRSAKYQRHRPDPNVINRSIHGYSSLRCARSGRAFHPPHLRPRLTPETHGNAIGSASPTPPQPVSSAPRARATNINSSPPHSAKR